MQDTFPLLYKSVEGIRVLTWRIWVTETDRGTGVINVEYGYEPGRKRREKEEIREGKNIGRRNSTTPVEQAKLEAAARWKKQLTRKGYGETVGDSQSVRAASCMLAKSFKPGVKVDWSTAFAQPKLDGFRCLATFTPKGVVLKSRENLVLSIPHLAEQLAQVMERGEVFDGELYVHGMSFNKLASAVKKKTDNTLIEQIRFNAYDTVRDWDFATRFERLRKAFSQGMEHLDLVKTVKVRNSDELGVVEKECLDDGYEGAMLRHSRKGYVNGKRADCLLKVKQFHDEEFEVFDAKSGRGSHEGMAIFSCKTKDGHEFDVTAPGTQEEKREYWKNWKNYIGKKLTVKFFEYTTGDEPVPRFPVAKAFRE